MRLRKSLMTKQSIYGHMTNMFYPDVKTSCSKSVIKGQTFANVDISLRTFKTFSWKKGCSKDTYHDAVFAA